MPAERYRFLITVLQAIDPTAELVECVAQPAPPGYRIRVRIAGGASTVMHLAAPVVERAHAADPLADYTLRAMLRRMLDELEGQAAAKPQRPPGRLGPPPSSG